MGSLSIWHWLIVLVIVMLIFGTKKLRNMGADLGGAVRGFKDGMREGGEKPADAPAPPQVTGKTAEGEGKSRTEHKAGTGTLHEKAPPGAFLVSAPMFDIGFSELLVIGVVALIVIGPERLPRVARTVGVLAGRLQRYVADVKADINREIEL